MLFARKIFPHIGHSMWQSVFSPRKKRPPLLPLFQGDRIRKSLSPCKETSYKKRSAFVELEELVLNAARWLDKQTRGYCTHCRGLEAISFPQDLRRSGPPGFVINLFNVAPHRRERKVTFQDHGLRDWSQQVFSDKNESRGIVRKTATKFIRSRGNACPINLDSELI